MNTLTINEITNNSNCYIKYTKLNRNQINRMLCVLMACLIGLFSVISVKACYSKDDIKTQEHSVQIDFGLLIFASWTAETGVGVIGIFLAAAALSRDTNILTDMQKNACCDH